MLSVVVLWGACPDEVAAQIGSLTPPGGPPPPQATPAPPREQRRVDPFERFRDLEPEPTPLAPVEAAWRVTLSVQPSASGAMDDAHVYIPLRDSGLMALDRERGTIAWFRPLLPTASSPVARNGIVFVATETGIDALDAGTGFTRWTTRLDRRVMLPLVWDTGWLIAVMEPDEVFALRASDGAIIWRRSLDVEIMHPPASGGEGLLYFTLDGGRVVAVNLADGEVRWEQKLPGVLGEPAATDDRVFVGSTDNFFYALDADSGSEEWKWRNGGDVIGAAVDGDIVYFASLDNVIRAVNVGNGNQRWRKDTGTRPVLPPRAFGGVVALPGLVPAMAVFVGKTGASQGTYTAPGNLIGAPLLDPEIKPFRVSMVTITREGVVEGLRSSGVIYREPPPVGIPGLPGRPVLREQLKLE